MSIMSEERKKEYYNCCICGKLIEKENITGNYENVTCDKCWEKFVEGDI